MGIITEFEFQVLILFCLVKVPQLLCGETGLADAVLCKESDHVKRKGQSLIALQKCPMQGVRQPSKTAPHSSGGSQALYKPKNMEMLLSYHCDNCN